MSQPSLTIELVPKSSWYSNVRSEVSQEVWDRLRRDVYQKADYRCEVCGGQGPAHPVECHEVWEYSADAEDASMGVQRLVRMQALCPACHEVKHMGLAGIKGRKREATKHLMEVNGWTLEQANQYIDVAFREWRRRSKMEWTLDLSYLDRFGAKEGEA